MDEGAGNGTAVATDEGRPRGSAADQTVQQQVLYLKSLREFPGNPRRIFRHVQELAVALQKEGQLNAIIVRLAKDGKYEIADGMRRFRAAQDAGLKTLRADVRELTDREMVDLAFAANEGREELHPLEEADGYRTLHETHGATVAEIAARHGVPANRVYGRLALCALIDEIRVPFEDDKIGVSVALQIARLPALVQRKVAEHFGKQFPGEHEIRGYLARTIFLPLAAAPFDTKDKNLVEGVVACEACPKRTQNQRHLFEADEAAASAIDSCTDAACWATKRDAHLIKLRERVAKAKGTFVEWPASKKYFTPGLRTVAFASGMIEPDKLSAELSNGAAMAESRSLVALCGQGILRESILATDADGNPRWLIGVKEAKQALKVAGHVELARRLREPNEEQKEEAADLTKRKRGPLVALAIESLVKKASEPAPYPLGFWTFLVGVIVKLSSMTVLTAVWKRRGFGANNRKCSRQDMERELLALRAMGDKRCRGLLFEFGVSIDAYAPAPGEGNGVLMTEACKLYRVPLAKYLAGETVVEIDEAVEEGAEGEEGEAKPSVVKAGGKKSKPSVAKVKPERKQVKPSLTGPVKVAKKVAKKGSAWAVPKPKGSKP